MTNHISPSKATQSSTFRQKIYPFFWFIAAADRDLLFRCPVPEQDKLASVGLAILCTTIAATFSCFYAVFSLFNSAVSAVPVAIFWGLIIFNLDRFMVGSIKKERQRNIGREWKLASPRIVLAFFIAILISKPLEIQLFRNQIEEEKDNYNNTLLTSHLSLVSQELEQTKNEAREAAGNKKEAEENSRNPDMSPLYRSAKQDYTNCIQQQARLDGLLDRRYIERQESANAGDSDKTNSLSREIADLKQRINRLGCPEKESVMNKAAAEYTGAELLRAKQQTAIGDSLLLKAQQEARLRENQKKVQQGKIKGALNDILGELRVLNVLQKKDPGMLWAGLLINALFFILEIAPIMVKIMSPRGEYDTLISISLQQALDREEAEEEESRQEKITRKQAATQDTVEANQIDGEIKRRIKEKIMEAQASLAEKVIAAWHEQEENELAADKAGYLQRKIK